MSSNTLMPDPDLEESDALNNNISHSVAMVRTIPTYDTATYMDAQIDDLYEDGRDLQEDGNVSLTTIEASDDILIFDWNIFYLARFTMSLVLVLLSLVINLSIVIIILRNQGLRKTGYFKLHMFFLAINTLYLMSTCPYRAIMAHTAMFHYWGWVLPGSSSLLNVLTNPWLLKAITDLPHCLLGLQAWILCGMTIDCRMSMSWSFHNRTRFISGTRLTFTILSVLISISAMAFISVLRQKSFVLFKNGFSTASDELFGEDDLYKTVIIYTIFILILTVLPIFMIVLIGVSNCISFSASSRKWHLPQRLAIILDRRYNISSLVLLALMLVHFTRKMSEEVDAGVHFGSEEDFSDVSLIVSEVVNLLVDVNVIFFTFLTASALCCCPGLKQNTPSQEDGSNKII